MKRMLSAAFVFVGTLCIGVTANAADAFTNYGPTGAYDAAPGDCLAHRRTGRWVGKYCRAVYVGGQRLTRQRDRKPGLRIGRHQLGRQPKKR